MRHSHRDLLIVVGLALLTLGLSLLGVEQPIIRLISGLVLALVLPGYALAAALFPMPSLPTTDRMLYTLGLSLCSAILSGFLLNATPWGLAPQPWAIVLAFLTLAGVVIAYARRQTQFQHQAPAANAAPALPRPSWQAQLFPAIQLGLALLIVLGSVSFATMEAHKLPAPEVLQLWMLPDSQPGQQGLRIGLDSIGPAAGTFRLQIVRNGFVLHEWPTIQLAPGQRWEERLQLKGELPGDGPFEARLMQADHPHTVIRSVTMWPEQP